MEQDPSKNLSDARKQMVEQRRHVVRSLASGHDREQLEAHINMMMKIQTAIDVIDRVAEEEHARPDNDVDGRAGRRIAAVTSSG